MDGPQRFRHEDNKNDPPALQKYTEKFRGFPSDSICILGINHFDSHGLYEIIAGAGRKWLGKTSHSFLSEHRLVQVEKFATSLLSHKRHSFFHSSFRDSFSCHHCSMEGVRPHKRLNKQVSH